MVSLNIYKNYANQFVRKIGSKIMNEIEDRSQSKIDKDINSVKMHFVSPDLEILTSIGGELRHGQVQNGVNCDI